MLPTLAHPRRTRARTPLQPVSACGWSFPSQSCARVCSANTPRSREGSWSRLTKAYGIWLLKRIAIGRHLRVDFYLLHVVTRARVAARFACIGIPCRPLAKHLKHDFVAEFDYCIHWPRICTATTSLCVGRVVTTTLSPTYESSRRALRYLAMRRSPLSRATRLPSAVIG